MQKLGQNAKYFTQRISKFDVKLNFIANSISFHINVHLKLIH